MAGYQPRPSEEATSPACVASYLRALLTRLENELRGIHCPSDRADHQELIADVRAAMESIQK